MVERTQNTSLKETFGDMAETIHRYMEDCRALVEKSESREYKIAAKIQGVTPENGNFSISRPNIKLPQLEGLKGRLGGASDTIHAETSVIMFAPNTDNSTLYVTDPLCPNCMKNALEAGVSRIFIDAQGFDKRWYQQRQDYFDHISLKLAKKAGVEIYSVNTDNRTTTPLTTPDPRRSVKVNDPPEIIYLTNNQKLGDYIADSHRIFGERPFALSTGWDENNRPVLIRAVEAYTAGISDADKGLLKEMESYNTDNKYRLYNDPATRLMMLSSRHGISLRGQNMYCSHLPSARCQVNAVGYGTKDILIDKIHSDTNTNDLDAALSLHKAGIIKYHFNAPNIDLNTIMQRTSSANLSKDKPKNTKV